MTNGMFDALLKAIEKTGDTALMLQFQHEMFYQQLQQRKETERMIEEIVERVLSRISATADVSEIFDAIDGLNDKINSLERN
jgi:hypothetical protein